MLSLYSSEQREKKVLNSANRRGSNLEFEECWSFIGMFIELVSGGLDIWVSLVVLKWVPEQFLADRRTE